MSSFTLILFIFGQTFVMPGFPTKDQCATAALSSVVNLELYAGPAEIKAEKDATRWTCIQLPANMNPKLPL